MAKDKKLFKKTYAAGLIVLAIILFSIPFFTADIFINRGYFAGRNLERAFNARMTGNCEAFLKYVAVDRDNWQIKCENEKTLKTDPLYDFEVRKMTMSKEKIFIQAEITRVSQKYPATYEMALKGGTWMINQNSGL